jgi:hypothetical protein
MAEEALQEIQSFCEANEIRRLQAAEILELLADGEQPEWIAGQAADERPEVAAQLTELLVRLAPELVDDLGDEPGDQPEMSMDEQMAALIESLPPGVDPKQVQQMLSTPRGQMLADFGAFCEEKGYEDSDEELMRIAHEEWLQTPRPSLEGKKPADILEGGRLLPDKVETFRREEPKVGRNDPCPCGSGKKYKKCHGKN